jgi:hypothetical protein
LFKIPGENQYGFVIQISTGEFNLILRMPTGNDVIWLYDSNLDLALTETFVKLYERLHVKSSEDLLELDIADFERVAGVIQRDCLSKVLITPPTLLEIIFLIGGRAFRPDYRLWFEHPIEDLLAMVESVKKYPLL